MKLLIFFIVVTLALTYLLTFWGNRHTKVKFHMFGKSVEISLGLLTFGVFLDGVIIGMVLIWLL